MRERLGRTSFVFNAGILAAVSMFANQGLQSRNKDSFAAIADATRQKL